MTQKLTLLFTLVIMVSVVFSASDDAKKSSRLVVTPLKLDRVLGDPTDPRPRTVGDIVADLTLKQSFPLAKFTVEQERRPLIIVRSDKGFRIDKSSPLYDKVEKAAAEIEQERIEKHAKDYPDDPPLQPREVTPEDRDAIICKLFGININMSNKEILRKIAERTKKPLAEVKYEALGMVPKERPDDNSLPDRD